MRLRMYFFIGSALLGTNALGADRAAVTADFHALNPDTRTHLTPVGRISRLYGAPFSFGATAEESAETFRADYAGVFGVDADDLVPGVQGTVSQGMNYNRETGEYGFTLFQYTQHADDIPVYRAYLGLLVSNLPGHSLVLATSTLRDLGDFTVPASGTAIRVDLGQAAALAEVPNLINFSDPQPVIWAGIDDMVVEPRLGVEFIGDNEPVVGEPTKYVFITDAETGEVLYKESLIYHSNISGNVSHNVTDVLPAKADICNNENVQPMKYARVARGAAFVYADANGNFNIDDGGASPVNLTFDVRGRWFRVFNSAGAETTNTQAASAPGPANFVHNTANTVETYRAEVNSYNSANIVRDYTLVYKPNYPVIAAQTEYTVNVMVSGTCNAFYDGGSINFYPAGGACPNTAFSTVVYHEYGHHLVSSAGSGQGAYGEGMGDVMGVLITNDSILGYGFQSNCNAGIRNANNGCQYSASCSSCGSEVHACGTLISGCVWSVRTNLLATNPGTYRDIISKLAINSMPLHAGSSSIQSDITIDYLTLDDDPTNGYGGNNNINDGTPHYTEINNGFTAHNLAGPAIQLLSFTYPNGRPTSVNPSGGTTMRVQVNAVAATPQPNTGKLYYRVGTIGAFTSVNMSQISANLYDATFPATPCGSVVQYYVSARTTASVEVFDPSTAPTNVYDTMSAIAPTVITDSFQTNLGWTAGAPGDTATTGVWNRVDPQGTAAQPEDDHTTAPGTICWVTNGTAGASIGANDVDGGATTLLSAVFDLSAYTDVTIGYWRWYSNTQGDSPNADTFRVDISNNGSTWVNAETVGPTGVQANGGWFYHAINVTDFVPLTATVRLRFIAEDAGAGSIVEAAVDDFQLIAVDCTPAVCNPCDTNCDGSINLFDIDSFVEQLGATPPAACSPCAADTNDDGSINLFDIDGFVACLGG